MQGINSSIQSPNKLYKNYLVWFAGKYRNESNPLSFKAWLQWAKNRNVINADAEQVDDTQQEVIPPTDVKSNIRKKIFFSVAAFFVVGFIVGKCIIKK